MADVAETHGRTTLDAETHGGGYGSHAGSPGFFTRWFLSTNHKDIGTLYILFAIQAGIVGALLLTTVAGPLGLAWALRRGGTKAG